jgi:hypothetical protein
MGIPKGCCCRYFVPMVSRSRCLPAGNDASTSKAPLETFRCIGRRRVRATKSLRLVSHSHNRRASTPYGSLCDTPRSHAERKHESDSFPSGTLSFLIDWINPRPELHRQERRRRRIPTPSGRTTRTSFTNEKGSGQSTNQSEWVRVRWDSSCMLAN